MINTHDKDENGLSVDGASQLNSSDNVVNASPKEIKIEDFVYDLPDEKIAKHPLADRDKCKLLVSDKNGIIKSTVFSELPELLPQNGMLIYNNTRVINARLRFRKESGAVIEIFCLEPVSPVDYEQNFARTESVEWRCFVGNSKRWKDAPLVGMITINGAPVKLTAQRVIQEGGHSIVKLSWDDATLSFAKVIEAAGEIPVPPYLNRASEPEDSVDYQTVFSKIEGSVAAPTAGLHFTDNLLSKIDQRGIARREVTLHVGAGTFQPVKSERIGDHEMHSEFIVVDRSLIQELAETERPVIAVGTTSVRTLESLYHIGCLISRGVWNGEVAQWCPYDSEQPRLTVKESMTHILAWLDARHETKLVASTRIIIAPGYQFHIVRGIITNFHQPGSTLLLLISAIIGDTWHQVYAYALTHDYRFLSYGDACLMWTR